jgi:hypothetical protein
MLNELEFSYFDQLGEDEEAADDDDDDDDDSYEDPPEYRDANMQPLPDHNIPTYPQEDWRYLRTKRYLRNDKMRLDRFMELANISSTNLEEDPDIEFPELYQIYA